MSDILNIGASGLTAYRNALAAISENTTNANTEGYARRKVKLVESPVSSGTSIIYRPQTSFGGVNIGSVERSWDDFKANDSRLTLADSGRSDARVRWLSNVESALDDGSAGIGQRMTALFNAGDMLAADPGGSLARNTFLFAAKNVADAFRTSADALRTTANNLETEAIATADAINADLAALGKVNLGLRRAGQGTSAHAQLLDERDRLLDELSQKVGIDVALDPIGTVKVTLANTGGLVVLEDVRPGLVGIERSTDGRLSLLATTLSGRAIFNASGGALAGLTDVSATISDRRQGLDVLAQDFATQINGWATGGIDKNGVAGVPLLTITAGASTLQMAVTDPDLVPAAVTATGAANENLIALQALRGAGGVEDRWAALVAGHAQAVSAARSENDVTAARRDGSLAARDSIAGVDLDQEAADLLRFQQAYTASAKVVQVARDTLNSIFELM